MQHKIIGDDVQAVILGLDSGEMVRAEAGSMMYMTQNIEMNTQADTTGQGGVMGGLMSGLKRVVAGESFFVTTFTATGPDGQVCFAGPYPGRIVPLNLQETGPMLCQRDAFLCSEINVDIKVAFTKKLGAGLFGGEGFILQKLTGEGTAFIHSGGTLVPFDLKVGETIKVDTGCLVAFSESVTYDIQLQKGIKNMIFGGEGLFLATVTGPGRVYLQTLPFSRMADRIIAATKFGGEESKGIGGLGGKVLGGILSGD